MLIIRYLKLLLLLLPFLFMTACEKQEESTIIPKSCNLESKNHPKKAKYQRMIDQVLAAGATGVTASVISPEGTWTAAGGKADLLHNIDVSPCHTFRIGSMSKLFTAVTILKLQEEGLLSINDKINKYIPKEYADNIENANEVTIKQLLNHKAGIVEYLGINSILDILNLSQARLSNKENLKLIFGKKANFKPGEGLVYSNSHYLLLAMIIENVTKKTAFEAVTERIIKPLQLNNTYASTTLPESLVRGYFDQYTNGFMKDQTDIDNAAVGGQDMLDGGLISNAHDLAIFTTALNTGKLLNQKSWAAMQEFNEIDKSQLPPHYTFLKEYGLGLFHIKTSKGWAVGHSGTVYCFTGYTFYFPDEKTSVAFIVNGNSKSIQPAFENADFIDLIFN